MLFPRKRALYLQLALYQLGRRHYNTLQQPRPRPREHGVAVRNSSEPPKLASFRALLNDAHGVAVGRKHDGIERRVSDLRQDMVSCELHMATRALLYVTYNW